MNLDEFCRRVESWRLDVGTLLRSAETETLSQPELLKSALFELQIGLAKLALAVSSALRIVEAERQAAQAERQRYQELFEEAPDGYLVTDTEGIIQEANRAAAALLNVSQKFLVGQPLISFLPDREFLALQSQLKLPQAGEGKLSLEVRLQPSGCRLVDAAITVATVRDRQGKLIALRWLLHDLTEHKRASKRLQMLERAVEQSSDGIAVTDTDEKFLFVNPAWAQMHGYRSDELLGQHLSICHTEVQMQQEVLPFMDSLKLVGANSGELGHKHKNGKSFPTHQTVTVLKDGEAKPLGYVEIARDITERKQEEAQLRHNAFHDALTGLPNRALFMDRLERAIEVGKRHQNYLFAVLFLDLDGFKVINDSLGHTSGDQLLRAFADRLDSTLRPTDTAARLGGDEFTILLEGLKDIGDAIKVAERLQAELRLPFNLGGQEVFTTASIGIVLSASGYKQSEDIVRDADIAMYRAKVSGKARYEIFSPEMHAQAVARLQLETALRRAVERQEFRIHYQPIVALDTGLLTGFEALVRWQHPQLGLVYPVDFLSVGAETGLSVLIDRWVLAQACLQTRQWQEQYPERPPLTISVNLCSLGFAQPDLIEHFDQVLQETHLDARSLKLEITESVIMENSESATATLAQLRNLGIQLSIDDFGTGYSSLSRLHHFPINMLKLDRSFVSRMGLDEGNIEMVEMLVALAQKLGVEVTAEGVETKEQLLQLRELKCEYGQGYFFSRPLVTKAAEALIISGPQW